MLNAGSVTYKDTTGLVIGHTYSYRLIVTKTGGGGTTETHTKDNTTLPTINCRTTTVTTVTATPNSILTGASGNIALAAHVAKGTGSAVNAITGNVVFTVKNTANVTLSQSGNIALDG